MNDPTSPACSLWFRGTCRYGRRLRRARNRLKVRPLDDDSHGNLLTVQIQRIVRARVAREPVFSLDVFAIGLEHTEWQIRHRMYVTLIGNTSPLRLHYFQELRILPHESDEYRLYEL